MAIKQLRLGNVSAGIDTDATARMYRFLPDLEQDGCMGRDFRRHLQVLESVLAPLEAAGANPARPAEWWVVEANPADRTVCYTGRYPVAGTAERLETAPPSQPEPPGVCFAEENGTLYIRVDLRASWPEQMSAEVCTAAG